jgi:hypothetical protein
VLLGGSKSNPVTLAPLDANNSDIGPLPQGASSISKLLMSLQFIQMELNTASCTPFAAITCLRFKLFIISIYHKAH